MKKKLTIKPQKYRGETTVISMRLPRDMLVAIDNIAGKTGRTRNEVLMMSMEFALDNIEISNKEDN